MKIVLIKPIPKIGSAGDVKSVSDGYARNFLIPRGLAVPATEENLKRQAGLKTLAEKEAAREREAFIAAAEKLKALELRFTLKVGLKGRSFGSVTMQDLVDELKKHGTVLEREWIELEQGIKTTGEHQVKIKFPHGIHGELKVIVEAKK